MRCGDGAAALPPVLGAPGACAEQMDRRDYYGSERLAPDRIFRLGGALAPWQPQSRAADLYAGPGLLPAPHCPDEQPVGACDLCRRRGYLRRRHRPGAGRHPDEHLPTEPDHHLRRDISAHRLPCGLGGAGSWHVRRCLGRVVACAAVRQRPVLRCRGAVRTLASRGGYQLSCHNAMRRRDQMARYPQMVLVSWEIPWDEQQNLLEDVFRDEVRMVLEFGFKHLYIFGTAGEGYAVDTPRFRQIVRIFREETRGTDIHPQVGV